MKIRMGLIALTLCAVVAAPAIADEPDKGRHCRLEGAWMGWSFFGPWTATLEETTANGGSHVIHWAGGNGEWFGACEGAVRSEQGTGVFKRTGPRTFEFTTISFSLDIDGHAVCIWKNSGWGEVNRDCESGELFGSVELFAPGDNPFEDVPFITFPVGAPSSFIRMTVQPWVE